LLKNDLIDSSSKIYSDLICILAVRIEENEVTTIMNAEGSNNKTINFNAMVKFDLGHSTRHLPELFCENVFYAMGVPWEFALLNASTKEDWVIKIYCNRYDSSDWVYQVNKIRIACSCPKYDNDRDFYRKSDEISFKNPFILCKLRLYARAEYIREVVFSVSFSVEIG